MLNKKLFFLPFLLFLIVCCKKSDIQNVDIRIVSLAPSITTAICQMGKMDLLVGVTDFCNYDNTFDDNLHNGKIQRVSGFNSFNFEKILSVQPNIIFTLDSVTLENWQQLNKMFSDIQVVGLQHPKTFDEIKEQLRQIGNILDCNQSAENLCLIIDNKLSKIKPLSEELTVLTELFFPPYTTVGINTFIADIIRHAGGKPAFDFQENWPNVSLEEIILLNPDVIITGTKHSETNHNLLLIDAYKNGNIFIPSDENKFMQPTIDSADIAVELNEFLNNIIDSKTQLSK